MDHVSNLPDEVLCHILSSLTTKEAVSTSVLSKRWRNLIAFVPYLFIDDAVFLHPEEGKRNRPEIVQSFVDFVDRVLALQGDNSTIKKCSLRCLSLTKVGSNHLDGWISTVLARGVSALDLFAIMDIDDYDNDKYCLPPNSFQSKTLVSLRIGCEIDIDWDAGSVSLPMLKTLLLDGARIEKLEVLLHDLPALEELLIVRVLWKDCDVKVFSESLKTLTINENIMLEILFIDTPSLVYFKYNCYLLADYHIVNMKNLVEAQISFLLTPEHLQRVREPDNEDLFADDLGFDNVWKLFHGIQHVPYLYLSANTLEVMSLCCESMPVFNNLKILFIKSDKDRGWQAMPLLLRNCPHLESLVIEGLFHYVTDKCGDACDCISRENKGDSLRSCPVKLLKILGFRGTMKEMTMIKHFLDYFPCLKKMEIDIEEHDPTELRVPEVAKRIWQMIDDYNKISSCNVQLRVSKYLYEKWTSTRRVC